jgi:hypothetical protein
MLVVLGALIFGTLAGGLSMLMAIPLVFVILGVAVFNEGRAIKKAAAEAVAASTPLPAPEPAVEPASERPRTRAAGQRS